MPRKTTRTKKKKNPFKRTGRMGGYPSRVARPRLTQKTSVSLGQGFPKRMLCKHRYCEVLSITNSAGALSTSNWIANSMFDPNAALGGHQPMYYDQLSAIYNHYTVIGAKLTVKVSHLATGNIPARVVLFVNDDTTITPSFIDAMREKNPSTSRMLATGQNHTSTMSLKWSGKKTFGKFDISNPSFQGVTGNSGSSPTETSVFTLAVQVVDGISTQSYYVEYLLEQIAVWSELKDIASS